MNLEIYKINCNSEMLRLKQKYTLKDRNANRFKQYVLEIKDNVESKLTELISKFSGLSLYPQIRYSILSKGKRLRPILVILSAECVGSNINAVMPLALAFEMIHTATLIHDDIIDQDEIRRDMPALHKKWSVNDAILAGDALFTLSINIASTYGEKILKTVTQNTLELCDGEHMDITFSLEAATEELYLTKIKKKSASLFKAATSCGALAGGGTSSEVRSLSSFGENFGMAYQIRDDLLDLTFSTDSIPNDLKRIRITLPLIHLYRTSSLEERERLESYLQLLIGKDRKNAGIAAKRIQRMLRMTGSIAYCKKRIAEYVQKSINSISPLKESDSKSYLIHMTKALII